MWEEAKRFEYIDKVEDLTEDDFLHCLIAVDESFAKPLTVVYELCAAGYSRGGG